MLISPKLELLLLVLSHHTLPTVRLRGIAQTCLLAHELYKTTMAFNAI